MTARQHSMKCPQCKSECIIKNGSIHSGKQKYRCKSCGRQFVENSTKHYIDERDRQLIERLLLERISLRGIVRSTGISQKSVQRHVNQIYAQTPWHVKLSEEPKGGIDLAILEADELWSFVKSKENKVWVWLVIDRKTRRIVSCHFGNRTRESARKLWSKLPKVCRDSATCYTDFWEAYEQVIPENQHRPVSKDSGETNHIERFNNTLRQRVSRLVRKGLSFSKSFFNHCSAIWYFIHHYNAQLEIG